MQQGVWYKPVVAAWCIIVAHLLETYFPHTLCFQCKNTTRGCLVHNCFAFCGKRHFCKSYIFSAKTPVVAAWCIIVSHLLETSFFVKNYVLGVNTPVVAAWCIRISHFWGNDTFAKATCLVQKHQVPPTPQATRTRLLAIGNRPICPFQDNCV